MTIKRTAPALAGIALAAALAGCGQATVAPKPAASTPAASVTACTAALEKIGKAVGFDLFSWGAAQE